MKYQARHTLIKAQRRPQVAVQNAIPVMQILLPERSIESVGMPRGRNVSGGRALAQHLQDGIARDKMNEQKNDRHHQPDDWNRVSRSG